jgi:hypothetical protein
LYQQWEDERPVPVVEEEHDPFCESPDDVAVQAQAQPLQIVT